MVEGGGWAAGGGPSSWGTQKVEHLPFKRPDAGFRITPESQWGGGFQKPEEQLTKGGTIELQVQQRGEGKRQRKKGPLFSGERGTAKSLQGRKKGRSTMKRAIRGKLLSPVPEEAGEKNAKANGDHWGCMSNKSGSIVLRREGEGLAMKNSHWGKGASLVQRKSHN